MQQTCSRCGGLLVPGASVCNYCGFPVPSNAYPQQGAAPPGWQMGNPPPSTQYGYTQTNQAPDPYAQQYSQVASPPPAPPGIGGYGQPSYGQPSQPAPYGLPPSGPYPQPQPSPFGPTPQPPQKKSPALLIGVIVLIVIVLAGLGTGGFLLLKNKNNASTPPTANAATPTPTAIPALYQAPLTSDPGSWSCTTSGTCSFNPDGYHIKALKNQVYDSLLVKQTFDNLVIEVKGTISQGDPRNAGLAVEFRVPQNNTSAGYGFFIYDDGTYSVVKWDSQGTASALIDTLSSGVIHSGLRQQNDIKIVVNGTHFTFFANGQQINDGADSTYTSGYIGLAAAGTNTEAVFSNLLITKP